MSCQACCTVDAWWTSSALPGSSRLQNIEVFAQGGGKEKKGTFPVLFVFTWLASCCGSFTSSFFPTHIERNQSEKPFQVQLILFTWIQKFTSWQNKHRFKQCQRNLSLMLKRLKSSLVEKSSSKNNSVACSYSVFCRHPGQLVAYFSPSVPICVSWKAVHSFAHCFSCRENTW